MPGLDLLAEDELDFSGVFLRDGGEDGGGEGGEHFGGEGADVVEDWRGGNFCELLVIVGREERRAKWRDGWMGLQSSRVWIAFGETEAE